MDTQPKSLMLGGHYDTAFDSYRRPHFWVGRNRATTPCSASARRRVLWGYPRRATPDKAKRPVACICEYITLLMDEILTAYPARKVPEMMTLRSAEGAGRLL